MGKKQEGRRRGWRGELEERWNEVKKRRRGGGDEEESGKEER